MIAGHFKAEPMLVKVTPHFLPCGCEPVATSAQIHGEFCRRRAAGAGKKQRDAVERMFVEREILWRLAHVVQG